MSRRRAATDVRSEHDVLPPILRWVGGKRWLLPTLRELLRGAPEPRRYHEPFVGGGAAVFGLVTSDEGVLSDLNTELIETYGAVREDPSAVYEALYKHRNTEKYYYNLRARKPRTRAGRAARFIFLNHTSFNGIYRVNLRGEYNVPYGRRVNPQIPSLETLAGVSRRLKGFDLLAQDFAKTIDQVGKGDLVFLDPPYTVAHNNNGFVKYNDKLFSFDDQIRLSDAIDKVRSRGAYYILTNAAHGSIAELFDKGDRRMTFYRRNVVGGTAAARGRAAEYLFTNLP